MCDACNRDGPRGNSTPNRVRPSRSVSCCAGDLARSFECVEGVVKIALARVTVCIG